MCQCTDRNILEDSYYLVKEFLDFSLWEYRFASFYNNLLIKRGNSVQVNLFLKPSFLHQ